MLNETRQPGLHPWQAVGNTPLVRLSRLVPPTSANVYVKLEFMNPSGSIKDRAAAAVVADAEERGALRPGGAIVEATGGNMGPALAMVAAAKGYKVIIVMPSDAPEEQKRRLAAFGAQLVQSPAIQGMEGAARQARRLVEEHPDYYLVDQFANPAGVRAHRDGTGREILAALGDCPIDAFVAGVGTGATLMGVGEALRGKNPSTAILAVEPKRSPLLSKGRAGNHRIAGIGPPFLPPILNREMITEVLSISDEEAYAMAGSLASHEGLYVGPSSGANVAAALSIAEQLGKGRTVVTVLCDSWDRYLRSAL